jgi:glycosyltransferase involved in cell wall biosynthesis
MDFMELLNTGKAVAKPQRPGNRRVRSARAKKAARRLVKISVIIPAHNEEAYLHQTLDALRRQNYPAREIVVVANGCTDRTTDVARQLCDRLIVLSQKGLGISRNLGARIATGELLIFLDADTILDRRALRNIANGFARTDAAGTLRGRPDARRFAYLMMYLYKNFVHCMSLHRGSSGVIVCWKNDFMKIGGFNEQMEVCENSDLIKRLSRFGRYKYLGRASATTSMRRYERRGVCRMFWLWTRLWVESLFRDLEHRKYEAVR